VNAAQFLAEWTFRSSILISAGALLLWALRIRDSSIRLAVWTAMLIGSLVMPVLMSTLPPLPLPSLATASSPAPLARLAESPVPAIQQSVTTPVAMTSRRSDDRVAREAGPLQNRLGRVASDTWLPGALLVFYVLGSSALLVRILAGLALSLRLLRRTAATGMAIDGVDVRVSDRVSTPVTLGVLRPVIVLPVDWREWDATTLQSVLAHERSHATRRDPAVQLLSLIHRAALWHSPLSWLLHQRIVSAAEDASDDAAVTAAGGRTRYAEIVLAFMQRRVGRWVAGVPIGRYGSPAQRIDRILDGTRLSHGAGPRSVTAIVGISASLACIVASAQSWPEFEVADVHVSPLRPDGRGVTVMEGGGIVRGGRYEIYNATLVELIMSAYDVRADAVLGGPSWLALDRFDVIAKAPADATPASLNAMVQALLADRFKLSTRADTRPMPAWVLTKGAGAPKLRRPTSTAESGCRNDYTYDRLSCRNVPLEAFIAWLREGPHTTLPVVNSTGIDGNWDFDLDNLDLARTRGVAEGYPILASVERQLGLKLAIQPVPQPVVLVQEVDRTPTPNMPGIETRLPPDPIEFEVASIRPCDAIDPRRTQGDIGQRISPSGQLTTGCMPLRQHILTAWSIGGQVRGIGNMIFPSLAQAADIQGAPDWITSKSFNIVAKAPIPVTQPLVGDVKYRSMLRNLLVDRFKMKTRFEERPTDVYTLVAVKPNLKKADPANRSGCRANGLAVGVPMVIMCQNVTMAQFADELNRSFILSALGRRVVDETGMEGTWDLRLSYRIRPRAEPTPGVAPEPTDDVSPQEALEKQLGLKLREAKRPMPVFVVDHIEENPTEN
jgi:uncharacterized protein (TIGR03435 family)